jgi:hypothetical protein
MVCPSAREPRSTRATDIFPPCGVWIVRMMRASAGPPSSTPSRTRVASTPGASWRIAFNSRVTPAPRAAEPMNKGTTSPARNSLVRSSNT